MKPRLRTAALTALMAIKILPVLLLIASSPLQAQPLREHTFYFTPSFTDTETTAPFENPAFTRFYPDISRLEQQTYGKVYTDQVLEERVTRLEKTLFGAKQWGPLENRVPRIVGQSNQNKQASKQSEQLLLVDYLEQKLFNQLSKEKPLAERLSTLESSLFGQTYDQMSTDSRIKHLAYTMPISSKGVRLSSNTATLASTGPLNQAPLKNPHEFVIENITPAAAVAASPSAPAATARLAQNISHAPAPRFTASTTQETSSIEVTTMVNTAESDYFQDVFLVEGDKTLRWPSLTIQVNAKKASPEELAELQQAFEAWSQLVHFELTSSGASANVIINYQPQKLENGEMVHTTPITRPILQLDNSHHIRTALMIDMTAFSDFSASDRQAALIHQLGHVAGIWGHSDNPSDRMYPFHPLLAHDIPSVWLQKSPLMATPAAGTASTGSNLSFKASLRDLKTLMRIYGSPGIDIHAYSPYMAY